MGIEEAIANAWGVGEGTCFVVGKEIQWTFANPPTTILVPKAWVSLDGGVKGGYDIL